VAREVPEPPRARRFGRRPPGETWIERVERIGDAYGFVLFLILTTFVVSMTLPPTGWGGRVVTVAVSGGTAILALTSSNVPLPRVRLAGIWAVSSVVLAVLARIIDSRELLGIPFLINGVLLGIAAVTILRRVIAAMHVDFRTLLGAISVYTMQGLLFGYLFIALGRLRHDDVFTAVHNASVANYLFFSYTTLTTVGYGNLVPAGNIGQILAVFEMLTGQIFLVTLVAGLVSLWRPGAMRSGDIGEPSER
jgi:hypothetical protein